MLGLIGRAALLVDEPARAELFLREFLEHTPDPVTLPFACYHLAGSLRKLDREREGREYDRQAASYHFGTLSERLARERLAAEGVPV